MYSEDLKFKKKYLKYKHKYIKLKGGMFNFSLVSEIFSPVPKIIDINKYEYALVGKGSFGNVYELNKPSGFVIKILKCPEDIQNIELFKNNTIKINNTLSKHDIIPTVTDILDYNDFMNNNKDIYIIENKINDNKEIVFGRNDLGIIMKRYVLTLDKYLFNLPYIEQADFIKNNILIENQLLILLKKLYNLFDCGDLKLQNVVLSFNPLTVRLIDFDSLVCGTQEDILPHIQSLLIWCGLFMYYIDSKKLLFKSFFEDKLYEHMKRDTNNKLIIATLIESVINDKSLERMIHNFNNYIKIFYNDKNIWTLRGIFGQTKDGDYNSYIISLLDIDIIQCQILTIKPNGDINEPYWNFLQKYINDYISSIEVKNNNYFYNLF